jgi:hypothetical protein
MMCAVSNLSGYAGAALLADRTTAVSTSSTENTESGGPGIGATAGVVVVSAAARPTVSLTIGAAGRSSPIVRGPSPMPGPSLVRST